MEDGDKILPGNHARGWNDPPQFMYDAQKQAGTITATNPLATNKRVGHDLTSNTPAPASHAVTHSGNAPPTAPSAVLAHVPILNMPSKTETPANSDSKLSSGNIEVPDISDDTELRQYCVQSFTQCVIKLQQGKHIEDRLANDVNKRIKLFENSWNSGKLSAKAKPNCAKLCKALELEEYGAAHEVHLQLMTDHVSEVSQWMVGIKKLIQAGNDCT